MLADLLAQQARKLIVDSVARAGSDDAAFDRLADERHIADDIEQLMTRTLVLPLQGLVLDISQIGGIAMLYMEHVCQHVEALLSGLTLIDDDGIVEVAALDEVCLQQRFDIADEDEGAGTGNLCGILGRIVDGGKLRVDEFRLEGAHTRQ